MSGQPAALASGSNILQRSTSSALHALLVANKLEQHEAALKTEGYVDVADLQDADDEEFIDLGFKKPELRRLKRALASVGE